MSKELRDALALTRVPHPGTLNRIYHHFRASHLDKMNEALLSHLEDSNPVQEDAIVLNTTSVRPTQTSTYFQT